MHVSRHWQPRILGFLSAQVDDVTEITVDGGNSMVLQIATAAGLKHSFVFQTNHDAIIFNTTLLQLQVWNRLTVGTTWTPLLRAMNSMR